MAANSDYAAIRNSDFLSQGRFTFNRAIIEKEAMRIGNFVMQWAFSPIVTDLSDCTKRLDNHARGQKLCLGKHDSCLAHC